MERTFASVFLSAKHCLFIKICQPLNRLGCGDYDYLVPRAGLAGGRTGTGMGPTNLYKESINFALETCAVFLHSTDIFHYWRVERGEEFVWARLGCRAGGRLWQSAQIGGLVVKWVTMWPNHVVCTVHYSPTPNSRFRISRFCADSIWLHSAH